MILEPVSVGGFLLTDVQDLSERESNVVTTALLRGLREFPTEFYCEAAGNDPDGEFPIIRLQVSNLPGNQIYGGAWLGCNALAPGHTATDVKIFTRPFPGPVHQFESLFWQGAVMIQLVRYFLENSLPTREGGTLQVMGFDVLTEASVTPEGLGTVHGSFDAQTQNSPFLDRTETDLGNGKIDVRITEGSPGGGNGGGRP